MTIAVYLTRRSVYRSHIKQVRNRAWIESCRRQDKVKVDKATMIERFDLSDRQSQAILDMRLRRLTGLEREKIENESGSVTRSKFSRHIVMFMTITSALHGRIMTICKSDSFSWAFETFSCVRSTTLRPLCCCISEVSE